MENKSRVPKKLQDKFCEVTIIAKCNFDKLCLSKLISKQYWLAIINILNIHNAHQFLKIHGTWATSSHPQISCHRTYMQKYTTHNTKVPSAKRHISSNKLKLSKINIKIVQVFVCVFCLFSYLICHATKIQLQQALHACSFAFTLNV